MITKSKLLYLKDLSQKKHREKEGLFLVEGWRSLEEVCEAFERIEVLLHTNKAASMQRFAGVLDSAKKKAQSQFEVTEREFAQIAETETGQGVAAVVKKISLDFENVIEKLLAENEAFVVGLDQIADPGNLGAIIRTSDWFGVRAVLVSQNSVELYNPKVIRSTVGSIAHLPVLECSEDRASFPDILTALRAGGFRLYGADVSGNHDLRTTVWAKKSVLVIGNEARGISPEIVNILDERTAIPKFGRAESLNAGVAVGVFLSHYTFQPKLNTVR